MNATRKRRGRGEGGIGKRKDNLWYAVYSAGYNGEGKRLRKTVYGKSKQEVQKKLAAAQSAGPGRIKELRLTVGEFLNQWLSEVKQTVEPNTYGPYERHCRLHLSPVIGGLRLNQVEPAHVKELYAALSERKVSPAMQRKIGTTFTIALGEAVNQKLLTFNPATAIRKPLAVKPEMKVLDLVQVRKFLEAAESDRFFPLYVLLLDSGMRPGEAFALLWTDFDFAGGFVMVTKSLEQIGDKQRIKGAKTKKGSRRIALSRHTLAVLDEHRKQAMAAGLITAPVFHNVKGGYVRISDLHKDSFKPVLKDAGLPDIRLYDLRHTCATILLVADQNPKVVSERLGHSSIQITMDTYSHVLPTMQQRAADVMDSLLGKKLAIGCN